MNETQEIIKKGSKSFFLASLFFDSKTKQSCWDLYQWCRQCDDQIDNSKTEDEAREALIKLYSNWSNPTDCPKFQIVRKLQNDYKIPENHFVDLLRGFEMDVNFKPFTTLQELEKYAYHVAGVIGVKMSYIMGVSDLKAFKHAVDLGIAMQLTNIARDIKEDFLRGRIYLPMDWIRSSSIDPSSLLHSKHRGTLYSLVLKLLDHADSFYSSGYKGLQYLPLRSCFAVSIAGAIYSRIGQKIRRLQTASLEERVVVSFLEKCLCVGQGSLRILPVIVHRIFRPWSKFELNMKESP